MKIDNFVISKILLPSDQLSDYENPLRIEIIPDDQLELPASCLIPVNYKCKRPTPANKPKWIKASFILEMVVNEEFEETKLRIAEKLQDIAPKEKFQNCRYLLVRSKFTSALELRDDDILKKLAGHGSRVAVRPKLAAKIETSNIFPKSLSNHSIKLLN
jgi:hypothetical protein